MIQTELVWDPCTNLLRSSMLKFLNIIVIPLLREFKCFEVESSNIIKQSKTNK